MNKFITRTVAAFLLAALISQSAFLSPATAFAADDESATFASVSESSEDEALAMESTDDQASEQESSEDAAEESADEEYSEDDTSENIESEEASQEASGDAASEASSEDVETQPVEDEDPELVEAAANQIGDNVFFKVNGSVITIYGTGATYDYKGFAESPLSTYNNMSKIVVEEGVTTLGDYLLSRINNYTSSAGTHISGVTLPSTLESIGKECFNSFDGEAANIVIPGNVRHIGERAFEGRFGSIKLAEGITEISKEAFWNCKARKIELPDSLTVIGESAFGMLRYSDELVIPKNVHTIEAKAFEKVNISMRTGIFTGNMPKNFAEDAFYESLMVMKYPANNSTWSDAAVKELSKRVKNVTFVKSGTTYSNKCGENISWSISGSKLTLTGYGPMNNYTYSNQVPWSSSAASITSISLDSRITSIADYSFYGMKLKGVTLPSSLTRIGDGAFEKSTITSAALPSGLTYIGNRAFSDCSDMVLTGTFNANLTYIGDYAFHSCTYITATLPKLNCIEYIGSHAFDFNRKMVVKSFEFPETLTYIGDSAFWDSTTSSAPISLPSSIKYIGRYAFSGRNLKGELIIPEGLGEMGYGAFEKCGISSVKIYSPNISNSVFYSCKNLTKAVIGPKVTTITERAFYECDKLATVEGMDGVDKIEYQAFSGCKALKSITFGEKSVKLSSNIFDGTALSEISFKGEMPRAIYSGVWKGIPGSPVVRYPRNRASWFGVTAKSIGMEDLNPRFEPYGPELICTVIYKYGKDEDEVYKKETVKGGDTLTRPADPVKDHRTFRRWVDAATGKEYKFGDPVKGDLTLYADWNYSTYRVEFCVYLNGSRNYGVATSYTFGSKPKVPDLGMYTDDKNKYKVYAWSRTRDEKTGQLGELVDMSKYVVTEADVLYANVFSVVTVNLITGTDKGDLTIKRFYGDPIGTIDTKLEKTGKVLEGWYYDRNFTNKADSKDPVGNNRNLYAHWVDDPDYDPKPEPDPTPDPKPQDPEPEDPTPSVPGKDPENPANTEDDEELHVVITGEPDYDFGKVCKPDSVKVYDGKLLLEENVDYTYKLVNATKAGTATVVVTLKGNYSGTLKRNYSIAPINVRDDDIVHADAVMIPYNGKVQKKKTAVRAVTSDQSIITLKEGRDYRLSYEDTSEGAYKEPGLYYITITGIGNFTGTTTVIMSIQDATDINKVTVSGVKNMPYTGKAVTLDDLVLKHGKYTLEQGTQYDPKDFFVQYANNTDVGTAQMLIVGGSSVGSYLDGKGSVTGKPRFIGMRVITFKITGTPISKAKVEGASGAEVYTGSEVKKSGLKLTYASSKGETPKELRGIEKKKHDSLSDSEQRKYDYTYEYVNNVNKGTAKIVIRGAGGFTGSVTKTFTIKSLSVGLDEDYEVIAPGAEKKKTISVVLEKSVRYQKGGAKAVPTVFYKVPGKGYTELKSGKDYTVTYTSNSKVGTAGITVTGKGNFAGKITGSYEVVAGSSNDFDITVSDVAFKKTGLNSPKVTVKDKSGKVLANKKDYSYVIQRTNGSSVDMKKDVIAAGTQLKVVVTPIGNYAGTPKKSVAFNVYAVKISAAKVTVGNNIYVPGKSDLSYSLSYKGNPLTRGKDYAVVSTSGADKAGTAKVTIRGIGSFGGTRVITIKVAKRAAAAVNK